MRTIWKYEIPIEDEFELELPKNSKILTVQIQQDKPNIWALVNPDEKEKETRKFRHSGTGHDIQEKNLEYIGTYQLANGMLIFHVFEIMD